MSVIDEVKQKIDIVDVASQYTKLIKAGRNFRGLCPLHSEKDPSFFVYPDQQSWHCFGACNTGGDAFSLVMKKQGIDFGEALQLLAQKAGVSLPTRAEAEGGKKPKLYQINQAAAEYFYNLLISSPTAEAVRNYIARRGLSLKTVADFQLGFSPNSWEALKQHLVETGYSEDDLLEAGLIVESEDKKRHDRFRNRLMFPIHDNRGHTIGFGARALDDSMPKYLNSPQTPVFNKSSVLYGIDLAMPAIRQQDTAVIVEGYMDVITAHQHGFSNVVASMGTAVTERQIGSLKRLTKNLVLALDADAAGEEAMLRCVDHENITGSEIRAIIMPQGRDPDDVIKEDPQNWPKLLAEAQPVVDYTFDVFTANLDLTTAKGKSQAVEKLLPIIAEIKDAVRQEHYLQKLARLLKVSQHSLEASLGRIKSERRVMAPRPEAVAPAFRPTLADPVEEYCLALLLQHPELKEQCREILPEYFADTANREVFLAYTRTKDVKLTKQKLDSAFYEYVDSLTGKKVPANQIESRLTQCVLRLREKFLRSLQDKNTEALALAAELGGPAAELAKLEEQGTEISAQLAEVFTQRSQPRPGSKGG
ncbi:MAG TPA: DNA primase [Dehalococcoidales bacterium]|nr:DNA primase [Dehalococcoidales bacterium]